MAICNQCGKKFLRSWGQSIFPNQELYHFCKECQKEQQNIVRQARLQEKGKIQAQENFKEQRGEEIRKEKSRKEMSGRINKFWGSQ